MMISVKNRKGRTSIEVNEENVDCEFNTEEKYDAYGFQHIPSSIIDTQGIQNPSIDRNVIINELKRRGYIIDDE